MISVFLTEMKRFIRRTFPFISYRWRIYAALSSIPERYRYRIYFKGAVILNCKDLSKGTILNKSQKLEIEPINESNHAALIEFAKKNFNKNMYTQWAPYFIKHKYNGFIARFQRDIIGYTWWWANDNRTKAPPEMLLYNITLQTGEAYGFNFFIAPEYRGSGNAYEFLGKVFLRLRDLGYNRIIGVYGSDSIAAKWTYMNLGIKDIRNIPVSLFFFERFTYIEHALFVKNSSRHPYYPCEYRPVFSFRNF